MVRTPFRLVQEDRFAPLAAIHDVENRTVILDSQLAGRDARMTHPASYINIKNCAVSPHLRVHFESTLGRDGNQGHETPRPRLR